MTREEQLVFCKKCTNRKLDMQQGILCNLTGEKANFLTECSSYNLDTTLEEKQDNLEPINNEDLLANMSDKTLDLLRVEQNYPIALIASIVAGLIGAIIWAIITVATEYQIGYMAIAIGAAVGYTMRYFGKGIDQIFGITGAIVAILSCALGNFFSIIGFTAKYETLGYLETIAMFDYSQLVPLMSETFSFMDIVFYGFAAYEGYKFAFRTFTEKEIAELSNK